MNADPRVMEFFTKRLSKDESKAAAERIEAHFEKHGFGLWAVELLQSRRFIGFTGHQCQGSAHFTPCVEIGWRLCADSWDMAQTEAAREVLQYGFEDLIIRGSFVYRAGQHAIATGHGKAPHDSRSGR